MLPYVTLCLSLSLSLSLSVSHTHTHHKSPSPLSVVYAEGSTTLPLQKAGAVRQELAKLKKQAA